MKEWINVILYVKELRKSVQNWANYEPIFVEEKISLIEKG
jgi:hypothetical protein